MFFLEKKNVHNLVSAFKDELGKINWAEIPVRGSTYQSNLNRIIILQKKIIRIISKDSFDSHTGVLLKSRRFY